MNDNHGFGDVEHRVQFQRSNQLGVEDPAVVFET